MFWELNLNIVTGFFIQLLDYTQVSITLNLIDISMSNCAISRQLFAVMWTLLKCIFHFEANIVIDNSPPTYGHRPWGSNYILIRLMVGRMNSIQSVLQSCQKWCPLVQQWSTVFVWEHLTNFFNVTCMIMFYAHEQGHDSKHK